MVNKNWNQPNGKTIPFEWYQISSKTQLYNNKIGGNNNMYFHGFRGNMELTDSLLKIVRKNNGGEHSIPLSQIVSVIVKKPGLTSNGLIHIQTVASQGTSNSKSKIEYGMDMNTIFFTKSSYQDALIFKDAIENAISKQTQNPTPPAQSDLTSQLKELKELVEQGLISEDDYEKKKQSLLGL
jgi:hypothetical protein